MQLTYPRYRSPSAIRKQAFSIYDYHLKAWREKIKIKVQRITDDELLQECKNRDQPLHYSIPVYIYSQNSGVPAS